MLPLFVSSIKKLKEMINVNTELFKRISPVKKIEIVFESGTG